MDSLTVTPEVFYLAKMPHSEVCMHMRIAGKLMWMKMSRSEYPMVQLYQRDRLPDGSLVPFSSPITTGEAGVYHNGTVEEYKVGKGFYCYPQLEMV